MRPGYSSWSLMVPNKLKNRYKLLVLREHISVGYFTKHMRQEFLKMINDVERECNLHLTVVDMSDIDVASDFKLSNREEGNNPPSIEEKLTEEGESGGHEGISPGEIDGSTTE